MAKKSASHRKYTPEFKADVLRLVANGESILAVARKMGISDSIIHAWRGADKKNERGERSTSTLEEETVRRCGRIAPSTTPPNGDGTGYLKKSCRHFKPSDLSLIDQFIKQEEPHFAVRLLCNTLEVSKSSYCQYRSGITFQLSITEQQMTSNVQEIFWENRRRYGSRRVEKALQEQGIEVGRHQVRRLMQAQNWRAIQPRSFVRLRPTVAHHRFKARLTSLSESATRIGPTDST